jgi:hypothetical protein
VTALLGRNEYKCCGLNDNVFSKIHVEISVPIARILRDMACGRWLSHKDFTLR